MNNQAKKIQLELKKDALTQRQNGSWQVRFTVAAADMDHRLTAAPMGTRFVAELAEVTDDETPRDEERGTWAELGATKQAGIRCKNVIFRAWLSETHNIPPLDEEGAARFVRDYCGVASRADFDKPGMNASRKLWHQLDNEFQAWKALENA